MFLNDLQGGCSCIASVSTQVLVAPDRRTESLNHDGIENRRQLRNIMPIGSGHDERQRANACTSCFPPNDRLVERSYSSVLNQRFPKSTTSCAGDPGYMSHAGMNARPHCENRMAVLVR